MIDDLNKLSANVNEIFELRFKCMESDNFAPLEQKLQTIMQTITRYSSAQVAVQLRATANINDRLPTWTPLLNRSVELGHLNGDDVEDIFYGLLAYR